MFAEYYTLQVLRSLNMFFLMMYGRDKSAPTPTVCLLIYYLLHVLRS